MIPEKRAAVQARLEKERLRLSNSRSDSFLNGGRDNGYLQQYSQRNSRPEPDRRSWGYSDNPEPARRSGYPQQSPRRNNDYQQSPRRNDCSRSPYNSDGGEQVCAFDSDVSPTSNPRKQSPKSKFVPQEEEFKFIAAGVDVSAFNNPSHLTQHHNNALPCVEIGSDDEDFGIMPRAVSVGSLKGLRDNNIQRDSAGNSLPSSDNNESDCNPGSSSARQMKGLSLSSSAQPTPPPAPAAVGRGAMLMNLMNAQKYPPPASEWGNVTTTSHISLGTRPIGRGLGFVKQ